MIKKLLFIRAFLILGLCLILFNSCKKPKSKENSLGIGKISRELLAKSTHKKWFLPTYTNYKPKEEDLKKLKFLLTQDLKIVVFLGSWCGDSHREVPVFLKILDSLKFHNIEIYNLDRKKKNYIKLSTCLLSYFTKKTRK